MKYYFIEPEVPGHKGDSTIIADRTVHPMIISKLEYEFDAVPEDVLITSFPVYLLKRDAKPELEAIRPTGVAFHKAQLSKSDEFRHFFPNQRLPLFVWLKITGRAGHDDFGIAPVPDARLVVSGRVLNLLAELGISHADIEDYPQEASGRDPAPTGQWRPTYPVDEETGERLHIGDVLTIDGKRYVVHACDYTTGKPQLVEL